MEGGINGENVDRQAEVREQEEMTKQNFVDLLNSGRKEKPWKKGKEYPILSWQE